MTIADCLGCVCARKDRSTPVASIAKKRGCTDILWFAAFIATFVVMFSIYGVAEQRGADYKRIVRGVDWKGRVCGETQEVKDFPLAYWPDPTEYQIKVCTDKCVNGTHGAMYDTEKFLYYCVPSPDVAITITGFDSATETFTRAVGDLETSLPLILGSFGIALVVAFVYSYVLRCCVGPMVWGAILATVGFGAAGSYVLLQKAQDVKNSGVNTDRQLGYQICGGVLAVITVIFFLAMLLLRKRIAIAIEVVKEASRAVGDMKSLVFFPLVPLVVGVGFCAIWLYVAVSIYSVQIEKDVELPSHMQNTAMLPDWQSGDTTYVDSTFDSSLSNFLWVHLFILFWVTQFLIYFGYMVIAGALADWYFTPRDPSSGKKLKGGEHGLTRFPVAASCKRALVYHTGTIAFGAFIIAVIQFIRAVVKYIEEKSKSKDNPVQRAVFCAIQCCLKCVKCCMDYISKNSFVFTAVYGTCFCTSAYNSFQLLWNNMARVAAINVVGTYLIVIGKVLVGLATAAIAAAVLEYVEPYESEVSSPVFPLVVIFVIAFFVAALFMVTYEAAIDTIFLCFLIDEEANASTEMFASDSLKAIVNKYSDESRKAAMRMKKGHEEDYEGTNKQRGVAVHEVERV
ncbi:MAG: hypothetical protein MHM6MM_003719 [Cercozoa sp. M6MM]